MVSESEAAVSTYSSNQADKRRLFVTIQKEDDDYKLGVETAVNEVGVLFRLCAVLYVYGCDIVHARLSSSENNVVRDEFRIRTEGTLGDDVIRRMIEDLEQLLFRGLSVLEYLTLKDASAPTVNNRDGSVEIGENDGHSVITVNTKDKQGLMLTLSQAFFLMDIDIFEASIETQRDGSVRNTFQVAPADKRFDNSEFRKRLGDELTALC